MHALVFACITSSLKAIESHSDVQLRIHAPFADLYSGEMDYWLVRVENRGKEMIPVPDGRGGLTDEVPPPQFHVQTEEAALAGKSPPISSWEKIQSFGNGKREWVDKSVLEPGQAMEAFSWGLPGQLRTPPQGGKFRICLQVGPDNFVYSNWITRTRHDEPVQGLRTIHIGDPFGNGSECQIRISEDSRPRYLWHFSSGPSNSSLFRICEVAEGMVPDIQIDRERGQYVITFPQGDSSSMYFAYRCGVFKSTPWPKDYRSRDFLLTSYPVSAPSPIGFPMALFREDTQSLPSYYTRQTSSPERPSKRIPGEAVSEQKEPGDMGRSIIWIFVTAIAFFAGFIVFLIRRKKPILK